MKLKVPYIFFKKNTSSDFSWICLWEIFIRLSVSLTYCFFISQFAQSCSGLYFSSLYSHFFYFGVFWNSTVLSCLSIFSMIMYMHIITIGPKMSYKWQSNFLKRIYGWHTLIICLFMTISNFFSIKHRVNVCHFLCVGFPLGSQSAWCKWLYQFVLFKITSGNVAVKGNSS